MKLATGREFYANRNIVGIDDEGFVTEGYDGGIEGVNFIEEGAEEWSAADRVALAEEMIRRWQAFRDRALTPTP